MSFGKNSAPKVEPPAPVQPATPPPVQEDPNAKAEADKAAAAEKALSKRKTGRQRLVLSQPTTTGAPIGSSGKTRVSMLGGGEYPA